MKDSQHSPTLKKTSNNYLKEPTEEIKEHQHIYYEDFDQEYTRGLFYCIKPISESWFRSEFIGFENYPERNNPDRPLIFICNHSGMAFPWDAILLGYEINKHFNFNNRAIRALASPMLSTSALMNPFTIDKMWKRAGGIDATFKNFEAMMYYNDHNLLMYPEGVGLCWESFIIKHYIFAINLFVYKYIKKRLIMFYNISGWVTLNQIIDKK